MIDHEKKLSRMILEELQIAYPKEIISVDAMSDQTPTKKILHIAVQMPLSKIDYRLQEESSNEQLQEDEMKGFVEQVKRHVKEIWEKKNNVI